MILWCGVAWRGVAWCGVVWCGAVRCGVVWCGVVWCGVVWCGVVWCGVVWCGVPKALLPEGNGWDVDPRVQVIGRAVCVSARCVLVCCCTAGTSAQSHLAGTALPTTAVSIAQRGNESSATGPQHFPPPLSCFPSSLLPSLAFL